MSMVDFLCLQAASEAYATERLPDTWLSMKNEDQNEWLDDCRWSPLENDTTEEFFALIDTHSDTVKTAVRLVLDILKRELVEAACRDEIPLDMNDLDLQSLLGLECK